MSAAATPISPELALVCPDLRREWLAALPEIDPDWLFRPARTRRPPPRAAAPDVPDFFDVFDVVDVPDVAAVPDAPSLPAERDVPLPVAAAAYTVVCILQWLVWGSVTFALVAAVTLGLTLAG